MPVGGNLTCNDSARLSSVDGRDGKESRSNVGLGVTPLGVIPRELLAGTVKTGFGVSEGPADGARSSEGGDAWGEEFSVA